MIEYGVLKCWLLIEYDVLKCWLLILKCWPEDLAIADTERSYCFERSYAVTSKWSLYCGC